MYESSLKDKKTQRSSFILFALARSANATSAQDISVPLTQFLKNHTEVVIRDLKELDSRSALRALYVFNQKTTAQTFISDALSEFGVNVTRFDLLANQAIEKSNPSLKKAFAKSSSREKMTIKLEILISGLEQKGIDQFIAQNKTAAGPTLVDNVAATIARSVKPEYELIVGRLFASIIQTVNRKST